MTISRSNRVNMADVARESGVSVTTVSLVLGDKPGIPGETRERVMTAARQLGYRVKSASMMNQANSVRTVVMLVKMGPGEVPQANQFYAPVMAGIETACRQRQIDLIFSALTVDENNSPLNLPITLQKGSLDGILLVGAHVDDEFCRILSQLYKPVVLVDGYSDHDRFDSVVSDNIGGVRQSLEYLTRAGHRHIGFVGGWEGGYPSFSERRQGYLEYMRQNGLTCRLVDAHSELKSAAEATVRLLEEMPMLTALVGCNDEIAVGAMHGITELGYRVGEDISVIGFDDISIAHNILPPLTTMQVDKLNMGRIAVQLLVNRSEIPDVGLMTMVLRPKLIERSSVRTLQS
jgi:LacI family transcriptional regulator